MRWIAALVVWFGLCWAIPARGMEMRLEVDTSDPAGVVAFFIGADWKDVTKEIIKTEEGLAEVRWIAANCARSQGPKATMTGFWAPKEATKGDAIGVCTGPRPLDEESAKELCGVVGMELESQVGTIVRCKARKGGLA